MHFNAHTSDMACLQVANLRNSVSGFFAGVSGLQETLAVIAGLLASEHSALTCVPATSSTCACG